MISPVVCRITALVFACAIALAPVTAWPQTDSAAEAAELRQIILDYVGQFRSFKGVYQLTQELGDGRLWEPVFECRVQGDNIYLAMLEGKVSLSQGLPDGEGLRMTYTSWEGVISVRNDIYDPPAIVLRANTWMSPPMAYLDPRVLLFLDLYGETAPEWLATGTDTVVRREGMRVLSHFMPKCACSYDVYIDDQGLIRKLEKADRVSASEEEIRQYWKHDLFDLRRVVRSWEFDGYQRIDGVIFPTLAIATWYSSNDAVSMALLGAYESGQMTDVERWARDYTENPSSPYSTQTLQFTDIAGIVFNEPLEKKDFELEIPVGATVRDKITGFRYVVKPKWWWQRIPSDAWMAAGLVAILTVAAFGGYGLWRRYG